MTGSRSTQSHRRFVLLVTFVAALGGLLFGYDTAVISGAIQFLTAHFQLSPPQTGWAASCALVGCVGGCALAGMAGDSLGRRTVLVIASVLFLISAAGTALASSFFQFIAFRIVGGIGIGAASIASPVYIAEMAPRRWRGWLVGTNQLAIVSGMLLIYFVNYRIVQLGGTAWNETTGWCWMFASGALPAAFLFALLMAVPETPRFLMSRGRRTEAIAGARHLGHESAALDDIAEIDGEAYREEPFSLFTRPLGRVILLGIGLAVSQTFPMMNHSALLRRHFHDSFPFFFYAAFCVVEAVFVWKLIPETKGRTLEEIARSLCAIA
jgi:MFS transporter, SP family, xylose:H+ symportor